MSRWSSAKTSSIVILLLAQVSALSLWFMTAAVLPEIRAEFSLTASREAALSSAVPAGFVFGALVSAFLGLADRFDPRRLFCICTLVAAASGIALLHVSLLGPAAIAARFVTGAALAGVYPVGMKIAVSWGKEDRGLLVGLLVGALTLGSSMPHLVAWLGGADWRISVWVVSGLTLLSGAIILLVDLGPNHASASSFRVRAIHVAWKDRRLRYAYLGYLGHMWELYAMWSWIGVATYVSYTMSIAPQEAASLSKLTAFTGIAAGALTCVLGGLVADRIGKAQVTIIAMVVSAGAALATALTFGGPVWLTFLLVILWGLSIIPDSAQFSAMVADNAPPELSGSLLTLQTAIGFALTIATVQVVPSLASFMGWPLTLAAMAFGPIFGIWAITRQMGEIKKGA